MAGSRPTTLNFGAGFASALIDCGPVLGAGGSSPISQTGRQGKLRRLLRGRGAVPRRRPTNKSATTRSVVGSRPKLK